MPESCPTTELNMASKLPRRRLVLAWDMHYSCNYRCPYCFYTVTGWTDLARKSTYKTAEEWIEVWRRIEAKYGRAQLRVTAGEPFTYPRFTDVIEAVSKLHDVQITSNCSQTETMADFSKRIDPKAVELDCTFHPLQGDLDEFIHNVTTMRKAGFTANVCYLAYPPQMPQMGEIKKKFMDHGLYMNMAIFWGKHKDQQYPHAYTPEERGWIKTVIGTDVGPETVGLDPIPINGKVCGAGQRYAVVQADGKVYRCGQLCIEDQAIGDIFDPAFELFPTGRPCSVDFCRCKEFQSAWEEEDAKALNLRGEVAR